MRRSLTLAAVVLGLVLQAETMLASAFRVTPVQVHLTGKSSTLLTLVNESGEALRFQVTAFAWTQSPAGEVQLAPTEDITFFPALLTLGPGKEQKVRVGSNTVAVDVEKTYRIFFEELPPAERPDVKQTQVRILTKMGVPIFVQPPSSAPQGSVTDLKLNGSDLSFRVANNGNAHFSVQKVHVTLSDDSGKKLMERDLDGWYVLAGGYREYHTEVPEAVCHAATNMSVDASTDIIAKGASTATIASAQQRFAAGSACRAK
ncbi:MAG TPA: fimbria/pilus periplasmic chaperone [Thermoanaerobaculia bacterium]